MSKFKDSYGRLVKDGDTVLIEETYGRGHIEGRKVQVRWNQEKGMYQFSVPHLFIDDDFHSIHKFKRLPR